MPTLAELKAQMDALKAQMEEAAQQERENLTAQLTKIVNESALEDDMKAVIVRRIPKLFGGDALPPEKASASKEKRPRSIPVKVVAPDGTETAYDSIDAARVALEAQGLKTTNVTLTKSLKDDREVQRGLLAGYKVIHG